MRQTIILFLMLASVFACNQKPANKAEAQPVTEVELVYHVQGMTCDHCEMSIQKGVNELEGISLVEANFEDSTARVVFDPKKTGAGEIVAAIEKRGYKVISD
jgi:copper ion binding protein